MRPQNLAAERLIDKYFPVLDHGFVALKDYMGNDETVEEAARCSYGGGTRAVSDTRHLIRYLDRHHHMTPFEMCEAKFHIGMPIFCMRQWIRHRMANVNEYSGRYSIMPLLFYTPERENTCKQSSNNKQGRELVLAEDEYGYFLNDMAIAQKNHSDTYNRWLNEYDMARELARIDLPLNTYTYFYWKSDLRNIFNLMYLRSDPHAQWEIQQFSDVICGTIQECFPICFEAFQDYQQTAVTFTQVELSAIEIRYTKGILGTNSFLKNNGYLKREIEEFWEKLKPKEKRDFKLDISKAQTPEYFMEMIQNHAGPK